jgi:hypothetical protein
MTEIDFLPDRLRVNRQEHKTRLLWYAGVACCVAALGVASTLQYATRRQLSADLALASQSYETAQLEIQRLARVRAELAAIHDEAELMTYLRHPWPRTQIVAALLAPLPQTMTLTELRIARESPMQTGLGRIQPEGGPAGADSKADKRTPARRDLDRLRQTIDEARTMVLLDGTATDGAALHRYLSDLRQNPLFTAIELGSLESGEESAGLTRFNVRLNVLPGHGQPSGPPAAPVAESKAVARRPVSGGGR